LPLNFPLLSFVLLLNLGLLSGSQNLLLQLCLENLTLCQVLLQNDLDFLTVVCHFKALKLLLIGDLPAIELCEHSSCLALPLPLLPDRDFIVPGSRDSERL